MNSQHVVATHLDKHVETQTGAGKQAIATRFSRAASTYNDVADIQAQIAGDAREALLLQLADTSRNSPDVGSVLDSGCVLDIGCGTGRESARLAASGLAVTGLDIAPAMLVKARQDYPTIMFCEGDADALPFEAGEFGGVFSSMALQWSESPQQATSEVARVLRTGGRGQLAIMVAGSFQELAQARSDAGLTASVNTLPSALVWEKAAGLAGLRTVHSEVTTYTGCFDNIRALLRSITKAGAGLSLNNNSNAPMTRSQLQSLDAAFSRNADGQLSLTYHVLHLSLEK